jgi:hypothetical protein
MAAQSYSEIAASGISRLGVRASPQLIADGNLATVEDVCTQATAVYELTQYRTGCVAPNHRARLTQPHATASHIADRELASN